MENVRVKRVGLVEEESLTVRLCRYAFISLLLTAFTPVIIMMIP